MNKKILLPQWQIYRTRINTTTYDSAETARGYKVSLTELFSEQGNRPSSFTYEFLHCSPRAMAGEVKKH